LKGDQVLRAMGASLARAACRVCNPSPTKKVKAHSQHRSFSGNTTSEVIPQCNANPNISISQPAAANQEAPRLHPEQLCGPWMVRELTLGFASWCILIVVEQAVPMLALSTSCFWSLLCCILIWARVLQDNMKVEVMPEMHAELQSMETKPLDADQELAHLLQRLDANLPPAKESQLKTEGWCDASRPTARLFLKTMNEGQHVRSLVSLNVRTEHQEPDFPIIKYDGSTFEGGAVPIFWSLGHWPTWFPFCHSAKLIGKLGPDRMIWHVKQKIAFITADVVLYVAIIDRLDTDGTINIVMKSPESIYEGKPWLGGIVIPPQDAQFRVAFESLRLSLRPTSMKSGVVNFQCEQVDTMYIKWIHLLFWQTACTRIAPIIARMQQRYANSEIDRFYRNEGAEQRDLFIGIFGKLKSCLEHQNKESVDTKSV